MRHGDVPRATSTSSKPIGIGIVGAGFAGLRCAEVLLRHGFQITIFEARNRLGGRVAQSDHLGHTVDLGPNWIHGTNDNPMLQIAKATDTELHAWEEDADGVIIGSDGKMLSADEADEYSSLLWDDGLIADAFRYSNEKHAEIDLNRSLHDFFAEKAESLFTQERDDVARRKRETLLHVTRMWGAYIGSSVARQSLKFFWLEECIQGENPFVAGTYRKILEAVARPAKEGADIRLNTEVVRILSKHRDDQKRPALTLADNTTHEFDEVIITAPLGWLKRNKAAYSPALPPRLDEAIDNIGYGTLDKVYVTFPSAFWDTPQAAKASHDEPPALNGGSIDQKGTTLNVTATTAPLHQPAIAAKDGGAKHYAGFMHWLAPSYAPDTNPQRWDPQGMNLAALPVDSAHPTILFYIYGPCSEHIASLVASTPDPASLDAKLIAFFEPYYSRLPNYSTANPACTPKAVLATAWAGDKFAGYGSYSNFQVGLKEGDKDIECMRHGMPERGVWLAGEHTAPFVALGTSTGAYWAGEGVAGRIVEKYGRARTDENPSDSDVKV